MRGQMKVDTGAWRSGARSWARAGRWLCLAGAASCTPFDWGLPPSTPVTPVEVAQLAQAHPDLAALSFAFAPADMKAWDCGLHLGVRRYVRAVLGEKLAHAGLKVVGDPHAAEVLLTEHRSRSICSLSQAPSEWTLAVQVDGVVVDTLSASCTAANAGGDECNPMDALVAALVDSTRLADVARRRGHGAL